MPAYARPGTYIDEVLVANNAPVNTTTAVAAIVAPSNRGPLVPTKITNWSDAVAQFGGFTGNAAADVLMQAIYDALGNGARTLYGVRVPGTGATPSTTTLNLTGGGVAALTFTSENPGVWGNDIYVEVTPGSDATHKNLTIRKVPTGAAITNQQIVERWADLSLDPADARNYAQVLNSPIDGSNYVTVTTPGTYTFAAGNVLADTVAGGVKLVGGTDGTAPTGSALETALQTAVYSLDSVVEPFVLNLPGQTTATTVTMLADYTDPQRTRTDGDPGRGDVFIVVDAPAGASEDTAISLKGTYPKSDFLAVYYPNIVIADPSNTTRGATKLVPAGPSVVGRYMATDSARGVFKAPAGTFDGVIVGAVALDPAAKMRSRDLDKLNNANINAIRSIPGSGAAVIFGARTLKQDYITRYVNARRTIIGARANLRQGVRFAPFENNDQALWGHLYSVADRICRELYAAGGLKGASAQQAYYVICDETINTPATVEQGEVHLEVGLALQRPAEFVVIRLGQYDGGVSVTENL